MAIFPGEVYFAFDDAGKRRRWIVISREELNRGSYVLAVPLTSARVEDRWKLRNCVPIPRGRLDLEKDSVAQGELVSAITLDELDLERGPIARLDHETHRNLVRAIGYVMSAECEPD